MPAPHPPEFRRRAVELSRAADSLAILPDDRGDPAASRGARFSYLVFGAEVSDSLAPVVAALPGT